MGLQLGCRGILFNFPDQFHLHASSSGPSVAIALGEVRESVEQYRCPVMELNEGGERSTLASQMRLAAPELLSSNS